MLTNLVVATALAGSIALGPPPTVVQTVVDEMHGVRIPDDYRWLEALEAESEVVEQWTTLQNDYTRAVLDALPGRRRLERRLEQLMILPSVTPPTMRMNRYFYRERQGAQNQAVGSPDMLTNGNTAIEGLSGSDSGSLLAIVDPALAASNQRHTRIGRAMFLTSCSPMSSNGISIRSRTPS